MPWSCSELFLRWNASPRAVCWKHCVQPSKHHQPSATCAAQMVWTCRVNPECLSHIQFVVLVETHRRARAQDPQPHQTHCECAHTCRGTPRERQVCSAGTVGFARVLRKGWDYLTSGNPDKHIILAHNLLTKCLAWEGYAFRNSAYASLPALSGNDRE